MKKTKIAYGTKIKVSFTNAEKKLICEDTFVGDTYFLLAEVTEKGITVLLSLDDIEDIQGYVAAESNHTADKKLERRLDRLWDKLQKFLEK